MCIATGQQLELAILTATEKETSLRAQDLDCLVEGVASLPIGIEHRGCRQAHLQQCIELPAQSERGRVGGLALAGCWGQRERLRGHAPHFELTPDLPPTPDPAVLERQRQSPSCFARRRRWVARGGEQMRTLTGRFKQDPGAVDVARQALGFGQTAACLLGASCEPSRGPFEQPPMRFHRGDHRGCAQLEHRVGQLRQTLGRSIAAGCHGLLETSMRLEDEEAAHVK